MCSGHLLIGIKTILTKLEVYYSPAEEKSRLRVFFHPLQGKKYQPSVAMAQLKLTEPVKLNCLELSQADTLVDNQIWLSLNYEPAELAKPVISNDLIR